MDRAGAGAELEAGGGRFGFAKSPAGQWMRQAGMRVERFETCNVATGSNHAFDIAPHLLKRDFHADAPNQKWAGDISDVLIREGWLYAVSPGDLGTAFKARERSVRQ